MSVRRPTRALLAVLAGVALLGAGPGGAGADDARKPRIRTVQVLDDLFLPARLTVRAGTRVTWRWPAFGGDVHDVKLIRRPKGARRFHSEPAAGGYRFRRRLTVAGRYRVICTFHADAGMVMTIRVRR